MMTLGRGHSVVRERVGSDRMPTGASAPLRVRSRVDGVSRRRMRWRDRQRRTGGLRAGGGPVVSSPWPQGAPTRAERAAYSDATVRSYWLDALDPCEPEPRLDGHVEADLCIVGGGYTGLWAALHAVREDPRRRVVVLESGRCGEGASGRNGGFLDASLTHGLANGLARFPEEMHTARAAGAGELRRTGGGPGAPGDRRRAGDARIPGASRCSRMSFQACSWTLEMTRELRRRRGAAVDRGDPGAGPLPAVSGRGMAPQRRGLVHPAKLADGLRRAAIAAGVTRVRALAGARCRRGGRRRAGDVAAGGSVSCAPDAAGHERVPGRCRRPRDQPLHRAGLRLRADDRAAHRRSSWRRSAGSTARGSATAATSSTTTG